MDNAADTIIDSLTNALRPGGGGDLRRAKAAPISSRRLASCAGQRSVQRDSAPFEQFGQRPFAIRPAANRGDEGVETATQREAVRRMGCDRAQGYYFSRPLPEAEAAQLLANLSGVIAAA